MVPINFWQNSELSKKENLAKKFIKFRAFFDKISIVFLSNMDKND